VQIETQRCHDVITVDDIALFADEHGAVGVPVQSNTEIRAIFFDCTL